MAEVPLNGNKKIFWNKKWKKLGNKIGSWKVVNERVMQLIITPFFLLLKRDDTLIGWEGLRVKIYKKPSTRLKYSWVHCNKKQPRESKPRQINPIENEKLHWDLFPGNVAFPHFNYGSWYSKRWVELFENEGVCAKQRAEIGIKHIVRLMTLQKFFERIYK